MKNGNRLGWKECKLGEHVLINSLSIDKNYPYKEIEYLDTGSITNGKIESLQYLKLDEAPSRAKRIVKDSDIVLSMVRPIQRHYGYLRNTKPNTVVSTGFVVLTSKESVDPYFLYSFLTQNDITEYLDVVAEGSTSAYPAFTPDVVENLLITLPPLPEQRAIAGVLSSLDDKIDLLHRQNKTLEGMAETLWRKMFVEEADPGWKKGKLGDFGEFKNGINYSRNENGDNEYSILNVRDIVECKYVNAGNFEKISINKKKAIPYLLKKGDIVIVRSASPGESLIVLEEIDNLIYSGFSIRLRCYNKIHSLFLFQFLQSYKKEMDIFSEGTTLKNINQEILNSIELIIPVEDAAKEFNERVVSIYNKILLNQGQIRTLSRTQDILLPKLMSGEVKVKI